MALTGLLEFPLRQDPGRFEIIPLDQIEETENDRFEKDPHIFELAASIEERGIIEPLVVVMTGFAQYQLIAGHRRLRAAKIAGLDKVPCVVRPVQIDDVPYLRLVENLQRKDLTNLEIAESLYKLIKKYPGKNYSEIGKMLGKNKDWVKKKISYLRLANKIEKAGIERGELESLPQALIEELKPLSDKEMVEMVKKAQNENLSVKDVRKLVRQKVRKTKRSFFTIFVYENEIKLHFIDRSIMKTVIRELQKIGGYLA